MSTHKEEAQKAISYFETRTLGYDTDVIALGQLAASLALVEATERLAVAQETANLLAFNARITSLPDNIRDGLAPSVIDRAVKAGQRAMRAMGL